MTEYLINDKLMIVTTLTDLMSDVCCNCGVKGFTYTSNPSYEAIRRAHPDIILVDNLTYLIESKKAKMYWQVETENSQDVYGWELDWYIGELAKEITLAKYK